MEAKAEKTYLDETFLLPAKKKNHYNYRDIIIIEITSNLPKEKLLKIVMENEKSFSLLIMKYKTEEQYTTPGLLLLLFFFNPVIEN